MSCIVLHTGALGDIIVSIPVMVAARAAFMPPLAAIGPTDRLNLASEGRGPIDTVLRLDAVDSARLFGDPLWLPRALRESQAVISFTKPGELLANKLREQLGERSVIVPSPALIASHPQGVSEALRQSLPHALAALAPKAPALRPQPREQTEARRCLRHLGVDRAYLIAHPGSGGRQKRWPLERFERLVNTLADAFDLSLVYVVGPAELEDGWLPTSAPPRPKILESPPLPTLAALLERASLYVGHDSGPSHLALAVGARAIVLFGPSSVRQWRPRGLGAPALVLGAARGPLDSLSLPDALEECRHWLAEQQPLSPRIPGLEGP